MQSASEETEAYKNLADAALERLREHGLLSDSDWSDGSEGGSYEGREGEEGEEVQPIDALLHWANV